MCPVDRQAKDVVAVDEWTPCCLHALVRASATILASSILKPTAACGIVHLVRHLGILPFHEAQADEDWEQQ